MPSRSVPALLQTLARTALVSEAATRESQAAIQLTEMATRPADAGRVDRDVRRDLGNRIDRLLGGGWSPGQLARVIELRTWNAAVDVFADLAAEWAQRCSPGAQARAELAELGAGVWWEGGRPWLARRIDRDVIAPTTTAAALGAVVAVTSVLEPLPFFADGAAVTGIDAAVLRRVRALLAKAESTDFPDEAEALSAKAQELITRHAIDRAGLDGEAHPEVRSRMLVLDSPYQKAKSLLLSRLADANRCRSIRFDFSQTALVVGTPSDLDAVDILYTSLLTQATRAMLAQGSVVDRRGRSRTRAFRRSFLLGFADAVGRRLEAAVASATDEADADGRGSALPVLAERTEAVDAAVAEAFPSLQTTRITHRSALGWSRGTEAGQHADLGGQRVTGAGGELAS